MHLYMLHNLPLFGGVDFNTFNCFYEAMCTVASISCHSIIRYRFDNDDTIVYKQMFKPKKMKCAQRNPPTYIIRDKTSTCTYVSSHPVCDDEILSYTSEDINAGILEVELQQVWTCVLPSGRIYTMIKSVRGATKEYASKSTDIMFTISIESTSVMCIYELLCNTKPANITFVSLSPH